MRLLSQRLIDPLATPTEVVRHSACTQGQDFPGSTMSIALRTRERSLQAVRDAYDGGAIVRSWPMRGTLFVVAADDLGWVLELTSEKVLRSMARRRDQLGLDEATLEAGEEIARSVLAGGGLVRADLFAAWEAAGLAVSEGRGYHRIVNLALRGVLCQGPTSGKEQRFVLTEEWIRQPWALHGTEAVTEWLRRYIASHGPVRIKDFLWWTKLTQREVTPALAVLRAECEVLTVDGTEYWVAPEVVEAYQRAKRSTATPLLLPGFDEIVLGYGDRCAVLTAEEEALVVPGGNGMFKATVIHRGRARGTWRRGRAGSVEVTPFAGELPDAIAGALPKLADSLPL